MTRLERLQRASDILRRTSRFVVLTRRLQVQLAEMDRAEATPSASENKLSLNGARSPDLANGEPTRRSSDSLSTMAGTGGIPSEEDDNQRAIAKAALSIAELSQSVSKDYHFPYTRYLLTVYLARQYLCLNRCPAQTAHQHPMKPRRQLYRSPPSKPSPRTCLILTLPESELPLTWNRW